MREKFIIHCSERERDVWKEVRKQVKKEETCVVLKVNYDFLL